VPPRVYIDGLSEDSFGTIADLLKPYGKIRSVAFPVNLFTLKSSDAIVEFESEESAAHAAKALDGTTIAGRTLQARQQREYRPQSLKEPAATRPYPNEVDLGEPSSSILELTSHVNQELIEYLARRPEALRSTDISSRKFEEIIAELWRGFGYEVELTKQTRDGGYDVAAIRSSRVREKYLIECKRPTGHRPVGVAVVRSLYGVLKAEEATKGIIATTASLSRDATIFVADHQWVLDARDFDGIYGWITEYLRLKQPSAG